MRHEAQRTRRRSGRAAGWIAAAALLAVCGQAAAEPTKISTEDGTTLEVDLRLPADFDASRTYSVMVTPGDFYWGSGPPPSGWIVVIGEPFFGPNRLEDSRLVLDWLRRSYRVRDDRFHIAGWSANSAGVFEIAMAYPDRFLSVTGIAGMPGGRAADLGRLQNVRVQFVVGEKDTYWRQGSERWHRQLLDQGVRSSLEIIPEGEHVMHDLAGQPMFERMDRLVREVEAAR